MPVPMTQPMPIAFQQLFISENGGISVVFLNSIFGRGLSRSSDWLNTSVIANRPIIRAVEEMPP